MIPPSSFRSCEVVIDLDAVVFNLNVLRGRVGKVPVAATVKADAYGCGVAQVAPALLEAGVDTFCVASMAEGLDVRALVGDGPRIYVFAGFQPANAAGDGAAVDEGKLRPLLNTLDQIKAFAAFCGSAPRPAAVHIDTGMNRLGLSAEDVDVLASNSALLDGISIDYWMSHLACADEPAHPLNDLQKTRLADAVDKLPAAPICFANSAGCLLDGSYHFDMVRPGIALYGGNPVNNSDNLFRNVATVRAPIVQIRTVKAGDSVGYGATFVAQHDTRIAILAAGYADGVFRALSGRGSLVIEGESVPFVGRVSMDLIALDVSRFADGALKEGQLIEILGPSTPVDLVAGQAQTISYEILTALRPRSKWRTLP